MGAVLLMRVTLAACGSSATAAVGGTPATVSANRPTATHPPAATATPRPMSWATLHHYSGSQDQQTDTIHLATATTSSGAPSRPTR